MAIVQSTCITCGRVRVAASDVRVVTVPSSAEEAGAGSRYSFTCPRCGDLVNRPADATCVALLRDAGARIERTTHPAAGPEPHPESPPGGPALTMADLIGLHRLLQRDDWFDDLLRT